MLKTSALKLIVVTIYVINSVDDTKLLTLKHFQYWYGLFVRNLISYTVPLVQYG